MPTPASIYKASEASMKATISRFPNGHIFDINDIIPNFRSHDKVVRQNLGKMFKNRVRKRQYPGVSIYDENTGMAADKYIYHAPQAAPMHASPPRHAPMPRPAPMHRPPSQEQSREPSSRETSAAEDKVVMVFGIIVLVVWAALFIYMQFIGWGFARWWANLLASFIGVCVIVGGIMVLLEKMGFEIFK